MYACPYIIVSLSVRQVLGDVGGKGRGPNDLLCSRNARSWKDGKGSLIVLLLAEQVRGWGLMIFCARATRGRRLPSLDARNGRSISPTPDGTTSELGGSSYIVRRAHSRIDQATLKTNWGLRRRAQWKIIQHPSLKGQRASLEGAIISLDARSGRSGRRWRIEVGGWRRFGERLRGKSVGGWRFEVGGTKKG